MKLYMKTLDTYVQKYILGHSTHPKSLQPTTSSPIVLTEHYFFNPSVLHLTAKLTQTTTIVPYPTATYTTIACLKNRKHCRSLHVYRRCVRHFQKVKYAASLSVFLYPIQHEYEPYYILCQLSSY